MDSMSTQKTKSRKVKRVVKKSRVQIIMDLFFRAMEIIVVSVTLAKLCYELVVTFGDSGVSEVILANRTLAFLVGNAIVIGLFAKSGVFLNQEVDPKCKRSDLYEEFIRESSKRDETSRAKREAEKQIVTDRKMKQKVSMKREKQNNPEKMITDITVKMEKQNLSEKKQTQSYQSSKSENLEGLEKSSHGRLRRSETDTSSERFESDDELRYKIESFIARQRRNQNDD